ncbi:MAG: 2-succinyl-5-enolpyruvyl-6-hydroxy-3-cyclohexene-1-carboxylic-acid synthase [Proteobacteria bacterium]|nr:2-succinyl-5-enolpyruvyl-6-hydroxy-3-cyclohexene-1-carboxylic-acid synthase [Pseudomonadota bacterium]
MRRLNRTFAWAAAVVEELARAGLRHAVVSPGSRSAPLALALAEEPAIQDHSVLDERSAGYLALGLARAAREPVALLCTSGTAAAGYLPAVIEANYGRVPLLVMTADRPPELRDCDAGQTIRQVGLFGHYVRFEAELPTPEPSAELLRRVRSMVSRAAAETLAAEPGPVHLNLPLREPLDPSEVREDREALEALEALDALASLGRAPAPLTRVRAARPEGIAGREAETLAKRLAAECRGWLVCGPLDGSPELRDAMVRLASRLGWPILAEPLAQLRSGPHSRDGLVDAHDALLRCDRFADAHAPRILLRFGAAPTSNAYRLFLERHPEIEQIVVDRWGWSDPSGLAAELLRADPEALARQLADALEPDGPDAGYARSWVRAGRLARLQLDASLDERKDLTEPGVVRCVARSTPDGSCVYLASSLPVRDADLFWPVASAELRFWANRGANGIDGTLSSALGSALGSGRPCVLLTGDLALLHDAGVWATAAHSDARLTAVVIDNDGGGIFEQLPAARSAPRPAFERHLLAPHGLDLARALRGFGLRCGEARTLDELAEKLRRALPRAGVDLIVVRTRARESAELRRSLLEGVEAALESPPESGG